ncbi:hypothetical protein C0416_04875 [bacterium]|nr:hypothetical protein [bacterium]
MNDAKGRMESDTGGFANDLASLYGELCTHEKRVFDIRQKLAGAGLERSLNIDVYRKEIEETERQKKLLATKIEQLEREKFGEEIPRTKSGSFSVPLEEMILAQVQNQVNDAFKDRDK